MITPETYTFSASDFVKAFEMLACLSSGHDFVRVTVDVGDHGAEVVLQAFACEDCVDAAIAAVDDEMMQATVRHRSPDWAF